MCPSWEVLKTRKTTIGITVIPKRSEEHTSELQSQSNLVCRLLLEKKKLHVAPDFASATPGPGGLMGSAIAWRPPTHAPPCRTKHRLTTSVMTFASTCAALIRIQNS